MADPKTRLDWLAKWTIIVGGAIIFAMALQGATLSRALPMTCTPSQKASKTRWLNRTDPFEPTAHVAKLRDGDEHAL